MTNFSPSLHVGVKSHHPGEGTDNDPPCNTLIAYTPPAPPSSPSSSSSALPYHPRHPLAEALLASNSNYSTTTTTITDYTGISSNSTSTTTALVATTTTTTSTIGAIGQSSLQLKQSTASSSFVEAGGSPTAGLYGTRQGNHGFVGLSNQGR